VGLVIAAITPSLAAPMVWNVRLHYPQADQAPLYLQVRDNAELRIADSPAGLDTADPIPARETSQQEMGRDGTYQTMVFPEITPALWQNDSQKLSAVIAFTHSRLPRGPRGALVDQDSISADISISTRDTHGVKWLHLFSINAKVTAGVAPDKTPIVEMPDLAKLHLQLVVPTEGRLARIGFQVEAGDVAPKKVFRNNRKAACTLQLLDRDGRILHTAKGDLEKFGFT
jgi:hypothetical protein